MNPTVKEKRYKILDRGPRFEAYPLLLRQPNSDSIRNQRLLNKVATFYSQRAHWHFVNHNDDVLNLHDKLIWAGSSITDIKVDVNINTGL